MVLEYQTKRRSQVEKWIRISAHRRDDGSICAEYEPRDRCSMGDIEDMMLDMLAEVGDGNIEYEDVEVSPEIITIQKIGQVTVFELLLRPKEYLRRLPRTGPNADEARELRLLERSMRG
jgi:hypothetical protein